MTKTKQYVVQGTEAKLFEGFIDGTNKIKQKNAWLIFPSTQKSLLENTVPYRKTIGWNLYTDPKKN